MLLTPKDISVSLVVPVLVIAKLPTVYNKVASATSGSVPSPVKIVFAPTVVNPVPPCATPTAVKPVVSEPEARAPVVIILLLPANPR